ncbi:hypothetical protein [Streptomyces sp. MMG1121]|uniref:hypothetical protein n=1 Tax=Streptomyces sp. MMG1121 TaxID=1415544 RepID=UPI00131B1A77|nr:hypothetical protein [Streptomyces sp. MMG1121]
MTEPTDRLRRWSGARGSAVFLAGGALGMLAYTTLTHRPGAVPWGGLLFGAVVCAVLGVLLPRRRRH